jgi:5-methylcytosine-specific restriction endonuclease McrA
MAETEYRRLSCGSCGETFARLKQIGRPPKECDPCRATRPQRPDFWLRTCLACRSEFLTDRDTRLFCSKKCAYASRDRRHEERCAARNKVRGKPENHFTCEHCGRRSYRSLSGTNAAKGSRNRWCSMSCKKAAATAERERRQTASPPKMCAYFARYCNECGIGFGSRHAESLECGCCRQRKAKEAGRQTREALHRAAARVVNCRSCGISYSPLYGVGPMPVCPCCAERNAKRHKAAARIARKAKERAVTVESVDPFKVFERAGWKCYLCGCATPRELRGTHEPNAPELDHVVPLSRGGAHSYANTDCACRACNLEKSDQTLEELLV